MLAARTIVASTLALALPLGSCHPTVSSGPEAPSPGSDRGRASPSACPVPWMQAWAEAQGLAIDTCVPYSLDEDAAPESVAQVCRNEGMSATYLVDDERGRFAIDHEGWGHVPVCTPRGVEDSEPGLVLTDTGPGDEHARRVGLRDGRPVIVEEWLSSDRNPPVVIRERWDYAVGEIERHATQDECPDRATLTAQGAIVTVGGPEVSGAWVLDGLEHHHGPADAGLVVRAMATPDAVILDIALRDDEPRLPTATKRHAPTDVLVVHWAEGSASWGDPLGCRGAVMKELHVVRWVGGSVTGEGSGSHAASVKGYFDQVRVTLDVKALGLGPAPWMLPLTVELRDLDEEGTTRIATSELVYGQPGSLGVLVRHEADGAFPPIGTAVP